MSEQLPEIRKTILLKAPVEKVWDAVATSEGIAGWWLPSTFKPELGHEFVLHTGQYGDSPCKVTELDPPHRVGFDWGKDWHLSFELKKVGENETEFTLVHTGWDPDKVTEFDQPHTAIHKHMEGGWEKIVKDSLPAYLEA